MYDHIQKPRGRLTVLVHAAACHPRTKDTERIATLIGKPLTRFEVRDDGSLYFEFDPYGSIAIGAVFNIQASAAPVEPIEPVQPPKEN